MKPTEEDLERAKQIADDFFAIPAIIKAIAQALAEERMRTLESLKFLYSVAKNLDDFLKKKMDTNSEEDFKKIIRKLRMALKEYRAAIGEE